MKRRAWVIASLVSVGAFTFLLVGLDDGDAEPISGVTVGRGTVSPAFSADCSFEYSVEATIQSEITARIETFFHPEGAYVDRGEKLVQLRLDELNQSVQVSEFQVSSNAAAIKVQQAESQRSKALANRSAKLVSENYVSASEHAQLVADAKAAYARLDMARAQMAQSRAQLDRARSERDKAIIRAPFAGTVISIDSEIGETAVPSSMSIAGSTLLRLADTSSLRSRLRVNERQLLFLQPSMRIEIEVPGIPGSKMKGILRQLPYTFSQEEAASGKFFEVDADIDSPPKFVRPGMACRARIDADERQYDVVVPVEALFYEQPKPGQTQALRPFVVLVDKAGNPGKRFVEVGYADLTNSQVISGLSKGEVIALGDEAAAALATIDGDSRATSESRE